MEQRDQKLITPATEQEILAAQLRWIKLVQALKPTRPLKYQFHQGQERWKSWMEFPPDQPIELLNISTTEIIFDLDSKQWDQIVKVGRGLETYFKKAHIPFLPCWTGGKGMHYHIFLGDMSLPDDLINRLYPLVDKKKIDVALIVRGYLANVFLEDSGVERDIVDMSRINWSSYTNGALLRVFGGQKANGGRKTLLATVPSQKPTPDTFRVRFPERIPVLSLEKFHDELVEHLYSRVESFEKYKDEPFEVIGEPDNCPCFVKLKNGVSANRNIAAFTLARLCRSYGYSMEQTKNLVRDFSRRCSDYSPSIEVEHQSCVRNVYSKNETLGVKCDSIRKQFGEDICDKEHCSRCKMEKTRPSGYAEVVENLESNGNSTEIL